MSREEVHAQKENQDLKDIIFLLALLSRTFPQWRRSLGILSWWVLQRGYHTEVDRKKLTKDRENDIIFIKMII